MIITLYRRGTLKNIRFVLRNKHFVLRRANISFCGLYADGFHYVKLMTEKSKKKMLFCKICLLCSLR